MIRQHAIYGLYLPDEPTAILYAGSWRVATLDERLRQHREGECRTTAKMAARGGVETSDLRMRVLAYWMSGVDPNPENKIMLGLQAARQCRWNHPYALSSEDTQRGGRAGAHKMHETWGKTPEGHAHHVRIGGITARKMVESGWHQSLKGHAHHVRAGRIGGPIAASKVRELAKTSEGHAMFARTGRLGGLLGGPIGGRHLGESGWHETPEAHEAHIRGGRNGWRVSGRIAICTRWHSDRPKIDRLCAECAAKATTVVPNSPH